MTTRSSILDIRHAKKYFPVRMGFLRKPKQVRAVDDVTIDIRAGETLGLVGEFGLRKIHPRPPGAASRRARPAARSASRTSTSPGSTARR